MNLLASPPDPPEHGSPEQPSCCQSAQTPGPEVSLEELLLIGERDYAVASRRHTTRAPRMWLQRVAAIAKAAPQRPVLTLVTMALAMASALVLTNELAPQAMPEVCSTMMLVLATEFVLLFRQRRSLTAVAG